MFRDRLQAGLLLAQRLTEYKDSKETVVLGIPRGGIVVAKKVADELKVPLDIVVTRKIGAPGQEELAIGAIGPQGFKVLDQDLISRLGVEEEYINKKVEEERKKLEERIKIYRTGRRDLNLVGKTVILVDDGIATGATVEAAINYLREMEAKRVVLAVPVAPTDSLEKLEELVDELIALETPKDFFAVGQFYKNFPQVTDEEVIQFLK